MPIASYSENEGRGEDVSQLSLGTNCYKKLWKRPAVVTPEAMPPPVFSNMVVLIPSVYSHHPSHPHWKNKIKCLCYLQSARRAGIKVDCRFMVASQPPCSSRCQAPWITPITPCSAGQWVSWWILLISSGRQLPPSLHKEHPTYNKGL